MSPGGFHRTVSGTSSSRAATASHATSSRATSSHVASTLDPEPQILADDMADVSNLALVPPPDKRWILERNDKGLIAAHKKMSRTITKIFHRTKNPTGFSWNLTHPDVKKDYFEEFWKYFSWPSEWEADVHEKWESTARVRYSDMIHDVKELRGDNDSGRPLFISEEMWKGLCAYWDTPEGITRSEIARKCRMSEPDGPGTGYRTHRGGSKSIEILAQEMAAKEGIPLEKCIYSSFRAIHVNKDGTYMSKKAEKFDIKVKRILAERGEGADVNDIYMEVNQEELRKKQRMYGTGNPAASLLHNKSTSTSQFHASQQCDNRFVEMEKQLQEEREQRQRLEEEVHATKEMMKQFMSQHQSRTSNDDRRDSPE